MQKRRFTPSPAFVVSLIALFVALGGTSYAAITALPTNSVGTAQLKNNAVTKAKINDDAVTASKINSSAAGAVKVVGAAGAPAYQNGWGASGEGDEGVSFYKDAFGVVHFQGSATSGIAVAPQRGASAHNKAVIVNTLFTLPAGYRPNGDLWFAAYGGAGSAAYIEVASNGTVMEVYGSDTYIGLGNITFRAAV
jgi:hypothetical protein